MQACARRVSLDWRADPFASVLWTIDQLSGWDADHTNALYREHFAADLSAHDWTALARYAQLRRRHSDPDDGETSIEFPLGAELVSGDDGAFTAFNRALVEHGSVREVADALGLDADEHAVLDETVRLLRPRVEAAIARTAHLERAAERLRALAAELGLPEFLERALDVYHGAAPRAAIAVDVLWAPGRVKATQHGSRIALPVPPAVASDETRAAEYLGIVAHEFGHAAVALLPLAERRRLTNTIVSHGLPVLRQMNAVDEALQTALGNIAFVSAHAPHALNATMVHAYDRRSEFPYAIDALARVLAPAVTDALAGRTRDDFAALVTHALDQQTRLLGDAPRRHAPVALVYADTRAGARYFADTFPNVRRWTFAGETQRAQFDALASRNPWIARWWLVTGDEQRDSELVERARRTMREGGHRACALAQPRGQGASYDFALAARDRDGLRRLLIAVHQAQQVPARAPLVIDA